MASRPPTNRATRLFRGLRLAAALTFAAWTLLYSKSTAAQYYATLFFGLFDDHTGRMVYVNCGHNPPMVVRRDNRVERLAVTAPVVGLLV